VATIGVKKNEATAARRRVYFYCVDATDGMTAEIGEGGGQPQISVDGAMWTVTGIGVLIDIHDPDTATHTGAYYAELTQAIVNADNAIIRTRYKSAATAQCYGDVAVVDSRMETVSNIHDADLPDIIDATDALETKIDALQLSVSSVVTTVITNAAGTDIAADIIALKAETATIVADTNELQTDWKNGGRLDLLIDALLVGTGTTIDDLLDAIKAKTDTIGSVSVTVTSPVAASGDINLYSGDDYATAELRQVTCVVADATHALLLNTATSIKLKCAQATWTSTSTAITTPGYTITWDLTDTQTAAITRSQAYEVEAVLANAHVVTLATGYINHTPDIAAVV
jgi:hypothetical protein